VAGLEDGNGTIGLRNPAIERLAGARNSADFRAAMEAVAATAEEMLGTLLTATDRTRIACRAGCSACCCVQVSVLLPEALAISSYLEQEFSPAEQKAFSQKLAESWAKIRWMDDNERRYKQIPCAFLDERGKCIIHPVRPFLCRALNATSPEECRQALAAVRWDEEAPIEMNLKQKSLWDSAFISVGEAMRENGLESRSFELTGAIFAIRQGPELLSDFLAGKRLSLGHYTERK